MGLIFNKKKCCLYRTFMMNLRRNWKGKPNTLKNIKHKFWKLEVLPLSFTSKPFSTPLLKKDSLNIELLSQTFACLQN